MPKAFLQLPTPHAAQELVLREKKRFNVLACGRRWGKTKLSSSLAITTAKRGWPVGWFAPTYKILDDVLREMLDRTRDVPGIEYNGKERVLRFVPEGGHIEFWSTQPKTAGETESDVARGRKYKRIIYDEAAHSRRLEADWTRAIRPTLVDLQGDAWFPSTPRGQNFFYVMFSKGQSNEPGWASWSMPTSTNPHIAAEEIEMARADLPADAFEQEFLAKFLANAANPFGVDAIRACIGPMGKREDTECYGIDLAKSHDWTVVIGMDNAGQVTEFERWQGPWDGTKKRIRLMVGSKPTLIDSTGVGDPIVEDLQRVLPNVEGFKFTSQSKQQIMEGLASGIQHGAMIIPRGVIVDEMESFQYEYTRTAVRYTAPQGLHDDCVCAIALCWRCLETIGARSTHVAVAAMGGDDDGWAGDDDGWSNGDAW